MELTLQELNEVYYSLNVLLNDKDSHFVNVDVVTNLIELKIIPQQNTIRIIGGGVLRVEKHFISISHLKIK